VGKSHVPQAYTPTWQQGADQNFQQGQQALTGAANAALQTIPQYQQQVNGVLNNPNAAGAMDTANQVAGQSRGVADQAYAGAQGLTNMAGQIPGMQGGLQGLASRIPGMADQLQATQGRIPGLMDSVIQTGFDPQRALYDRQYQQTMDHQNAINAQYGVAGSPYGAGVAGDASRNFDIDWQNQQQQRQLAAISGFGSLVGDQTGLNSSFGGLAGDATGLAGGWAGLANTGAGLAEGANSLNTSGLDTLTRGGMLPYDTSTAMSQNNFAALDSLNRANAGAAGLVGAQQGQDLAYMGVGQNATGINQNARAMKNQLNNQTMSGLGQLFGQGIFGQGGPMKSMPGGGGGGGSAGAAGGSGGFDWSSLMALFG